MPTARPYPLRRLRRPLRQITERMAHDLAGGAGPAPRYSATEWRLARAVAVVHGVAGLLPGRVDWRGPPDWHAFLDSQREHTRRRQTRIERLLTALDARAHAVGVPFVALKGAALHAAGVYAPGERPMADLDLWVAHADAPAVGVVLAALGYAAPLVFDTQSVYRPQRGGGAPRFGEHAEQAITVEVHTRLVHAMPITRVDLSDRIFPATPAPGRNGYRSPGALMGHLLMHAAVNMQQRTLRLVQLHDIALLAPRLGATDWDSATRFGADERLAWWALPPLRLVDRYYRGVVPAGVTARLELGAPPVLRHLARRRVLADVSGSNLHFAAFPGLGWAPSAGEMLRYVGQRLGRALRVARGRLAVVPSAELHPWSAASHRRRLGDALLRRGRPDTLFAVAAALRSER